MGENASAACISNIHEVWQHCPIYGLDMKLLFRGLDGHRLFAVVHMPLAGNAHRLLPVAGRDEAGNLPGHDGVAFVVQMFIVVAQ